MVSARLSELRAEYADRIETEMRSLVDEVTPASSSLREMCAYHLATAGKRLRALLALLTAERLGCAPEALIPFAAACEMVHNATLVHDDVQDGDRKRRGRATVWARYGIPQAIDLGDAMFYYAALLCDRLGAAPEAQRRAGRQLLVQTIRVIDGQEREMALTRSDRPTLEQYFAMVEGKTSPLFTLAIAGTAAIVGAPDEVVEALSAAAIQLGILFQIQDDLLDLYGDKGRHQRGADIGEGKRSLMVVHALQHVAPAEARRLVQVLDQGRVRTTSDDVAWAAELFVRAGSVRFALDEIERRRRIMAGSAALAAWPALREMLDGVAEVVLGPIGHLVAAERRA